jgi:uncharacterized protein YjbJ (UPF0337 family)
MVFPAGERSTVSRAPFATRDLRPRRRRDCLNAPSGQPRRVRPLRAGYVDSNDARDAEGATMGEGKADEAKGRVKEATGSLTDNKRLEAEGSADRAKGSLKDVKGDVSDTAGDARDKVKDAVGKD